MGKYKFGRSAVITKDQSNARTVWRVIGITILLLVPVAIYIILTTLPPSPVTGKTIDKGVYDPYTTIKTDWFSFRVEKTWQSVPELSHEGQVYVYREMQGANPQGLMSVYINSEPSGYENFYSRVVPVTVKDGSKLLSKDMQPDCTGDFRDKSVQNFTTTQAETTFLCWAGSPLLYAVAGEVGGNSKLAMKRLDGSDIRFTITYRNLAFSANEATFPKVLSSFKAL
jgi:hypothetical protein